MQMIVVDIIRSSTCDRLTIDSIPKMAEVSENKDGRKVQIFAKACPASSTASDVTGQEGVRG